jgi:hypothetical protein
LLQAIGVLAMLHFIKLDGLYQVINLGLCQLCKATLVQLVFPIYFKVQVIST